MPQRYPPFDATQVRSVSEVLASTDEGLTNKQIDELLSATGIEDPTPRPPPGAYNIINKRDRLFNALMARQGKDGASNAILLFIGRALSPVRFHRSPGAFEKMRTEVNIPLAFAGFHVNEKGQVATGKKAETLSEARKRAMRLRAQLVERGAHQRLLDYCVEEIETDNYFHAVLEASKSLADEIRRRTGRTEDGVSLVDVVFQSGQHGAPLLTLTAMSTPTESSRQRGLADALKGVFASLRNPTAHEPKIHSAMSKQDALDELSHMSWPPVGRTRWPLTRRVHLERAILRRLPRPCSLSGPTLLRAETGWFRRV
jgi:uncharacterized protein (TIGR02391 family)